MNHGLKPMYLCLKEYGIANQFTLKVTTSSRVLRAEVETNFGYVITKGKAALTKWITEE